MNLRISRASVVEELMATRVPTVFLRKSKLALIAGMNKNKDESFVAKVSCDETVLLPSAPMNSHGLVLRECSYHHFLRNVKMTLKEPIAFSIELFIQENKSFLEGDILL